MPRRSDDVLVPVKLAAQRDALISTGADVAYGEWHEIRRISTGAFEAVRRVDRRLPAEIETAVLTDFWCPPAAYLFSRRSVEKIGGWHEGLHIIQDARFVQDCALSGARFVHCPGLQALYRVHSENSVSRSDPRGFLRECYVSALEIEHRLASEHRLDNSIKATLIRVYAGVARGCFETDRRMFDEVYAFMKNLNPHYVPTHPLGLALFSRLVDYPNAERVAAVYHRIKGRLGVGGSSGKIVL